MNDFFEDSEHEVCYGQVEVKPVLLQDDVCRGAVSAESAQAGVFRMEAMAETKGLDFNEDKSCYVIFGKGQARTKMEEDFLRNPVKLYGNQMKCSQYEKFLGDQMGNSLSDSVGATIAKRIGRVTQSIYEINAIVNDCRSNVPGGLMSGLAIWEVAIIPHLLDNSSTWFDIKKEDLRRLYKLQDLLFTTLFQTQKAPMVSYYWDCKALKMEERILKNKLNLLHHLKTLPKSALAREVLEEQLNLRHGLVKETEPFLVENGVTRIEDYTKRQWKSFVDERIEEMSKAKLLSEMRTSSKIRQRMVFDERYEVKDYIKTLSPKQARLKYRQRYFMINGAKLNFPSDPNFKRDAFKCDYCPAISSQEHLIKVCPEFVHLRYGRDLNEDVDLCEYLSDVMKFRLDLVEEDA